MHRIEPTPSLPVTRPSSPAELPPAHPERRSRAALNLRGLCPVCGETVARRLTVSPSETRETYCCPVDGETVYRVDGAGRKIELPLGREREWADDRSVGETRPLVKTSGFRPVYLALRPAV